MSVGKLAVAFGAGALLPLGMMTALAYQAPKPLRAPQRPEPEPVQICGQRVSTHEPSQEPEKPRRFSLDEMAKAIEELETNRAKLRALLEELESRREAAPQPVLLAEERARMEEEEAKAAEAEKKIAAELDALKIEDIRPAPPFEVPGPPPHEGAMIDYPYVVEAPDKIVVEVLEALPGRPITGERLVRPDGTITLDFYGKVHVAGLSVEQIKEKILLHLREFLDDEALGLIEHDLETGERLVIEVAESDRVFVDVTAYNSKVYYVQGDVHRPGRLPFTGGETVLDALNYAGGIAPTGDPHDIQLIRPARGSKPSRTYRIDFDAIMTKGDPTANLQLFPGDRLLVGRHPTVRATIAIDRVAAPISTVAQLILTSSYTLRSLSQALDNPNLTADQRRAIVDAWVELLWPIAEAGDAARMDKDAFRNLLRRGLAPDAEAGQ